MSDLEDYEKPFTTHSSRDYDLAQVLNSSDSDPSGLLQGVEEDLAAFPTLSEVQRDLLVTEYLPKYVRILLDRKSYYMRTCKRVNDFFKRVFDFIIPRLNKDFPTNFDTVRRLLHKERDFYEGRGAYLVRDIDQAAREAVTEDKKNGKGDPEVLARYPEFVDVFGHSYYNGFYSYNVNYFGVMGGFKQLLLFLKADPKPALGLINKALVAFDEVSEHVQRQIWNEMTQEAVEAAIQSVLESSEEEIRTFTKAEVQNLVKVLESLTERYLKDENSQHGEKVELFRLDLALKCIKSPYLERRIHGLMDIIEIIDTSKLKEDELTRYHYIYYPHQSWLSSARLIEWLQAHNLLDIIFGEKSHPELVKRSGALLKLLYRKDMFTRTDLDAVWAAAFGKHETERNVIMTLFAEIVPTLKTQDIQHFFTKISSLPLAQIDSQLLNLLNAFVRQASIPKVAPLKPILKRGAQPEVGSWLPSEETKMIVDPEPEAESGFEATQALELLWRYWQQQAVEEGLSKALAAEALKYFQDLVCRYTRAERVPYALRCIENIEGNLTVLSSLQTLKEILSTYSSARIMGSLDETCPALIERLDRSHNLLEKVYRNFLWTKKEFAHRLYTLITPDDRREDDTRADTNSSSNSLDSKDLRNYSEALASVSLSTDQDVTYYDEVSRRLDFLLFVYCNSNEYLLPKHVTLIWQMMVIHAFTQKEQDEFFKWFSEAINTRYGENRVLDEDTIHMVFIDILMEVDSRFLTPAAMDCFEKYFLHVNKLHGLLSRGEYGEDLEVRDINLLGIDILWEHLLQCRNAQVSLDVLLLLKKLYRGLTACDLPVQLALLQKCMDHIKAGSVTMESGDDYDSVIRIERALGLLSEFIEEFEGLSVDAGPSLTLSIQDLTISSDYPRVSQIKVSARTKIGEVRRLVSEKLSPPRAPSDVWMVVQGQPLTPKISHMTLKEFKIVDQARVTVHLNSDSYDSHEDNDVGMPEPLDAMHDDRQEKVSQLREMFGDIAEEVIFAALKRSGWLVEDACELLTSEDSIAELQREAQKQAPVAVVSQERLSVVLSNNKDYFDLLFHLLGLGNNVLSGKIWKLLTLIPINSDLYESIKSFHSDWNELLNPHCFYKLLYSLQIINSFIAAPNHPITHEEIEERAMWKSHFIQKGGFEHLYKILMGSTHISILSGEQQLNNAKCIGFLLNVVKTFLQAALMSEPSHTLRELYNPQASPLRRSGSREVDAILSPFSDSGTPDQSEQEFPTLVKQLSGTLAMHVLDLVKFPELVNKLLDLTDDLSKMSLETETVYVIENALGLLLPIVVGHPEALQQLFGRNTFEGLFISALQSPSEGVRKSFQVTFRTICQTPSLLEVAEPSCASLLLQMLLRHLPEGTSTPSEEYFDLTCELTRQLHFQDDRFLLNLLQFLQQRGLVEDRHLGNQDMALTGVLSLVSTLLMEKEGELEAYIDLAEFIYASLFSMPEANGDLKSNGPPLCKHAETRKRAFELLLILTQRSAPISTRLLSKLSSHHPEQKAQSLYDSDISLKSASGFVGLKNFGCTCYLNSLMQQLFMMPTLRAELMAADLKLTLEEKPEDSLLFHLQTIFANLQESEKQYYTPLPFVKTFRDQEGQVLNVLVQQDADEFFNLLCDRLENVMKHTKHQKLLRNLLGGTLANILVSSEADAAYTSEHEEQFMRMSLEIKGKKTLAEALDLFIVEDLLEGENKYFCEQYNRKINAKKRVLIDSLSNTVIIHLKRFAFDFTTMQRFKINDYCEFPLELNLKPWCKDNPDRAVDYYEYKLMGVLVHSGIAEAGHYYSLTCDRQSGKWFEFNDHTVKEFPIEDLKEECFGGTGFTSVNSVWGGQTYQRSRSAYMLVYERVKPEPIPEDSLEEVTAREEAMTKWKIENQSREILQGVWAENMEFLRDRQYFDRTYHHFLKAFVANFPLKPVLAINPALSVNETIIRSRCLTKYFVEHNRISLEQILHSPEQQEFIACFQAELQRTLISDDETDLGLKVVKMAVQYAFDLGLRAKQTELLREWIVLIMNLVPTNGPAAVWMLKKLTPDTRSPTGLVDMLLDERQLETRETFAQLLTTLISTVHGLEKGYFLHTEKLVSSFFQTGSMYDVPAYEEVYLASSARFIKVFITDLLHISRRYWKRYDEYFKVMSDMLNLGEDVFRLMLDCELINSLLEFFMNCNMPFGEDAMKVAMGDQRTYPDMNAVVEIISRMIRKTVTADMLAASTYPRTLSLADSVIPLPQSTLDLVKDVHIIEALCLHKRLEPVQTIFEHLSYESNSLSKAIIERILSSLMNNRQKWSDASNFLRILTSLLKLRDRVADYRAGLLFTAMVSQFSYSPNLPFLDALAQYRSTFVMFTSIVLVWLSEMLAIPEVRTAAWQVRKRIDWIKYYLLQDSRYIHQNYFTDYKGTSTILTESLAKAREIYTKFFNEQEESSNTSEEEKAQSALREADDYQWGSHTADNEGEDDIMKNPD